MHSVSAAPELRPVPSVEWQSEWDSLMADLWLRRKTDRTRRMAEHLAYVDKYLPEIKTAEPGIVLDIGPGCGELLEIARQYGHTAIGVDSPDGKGGMGGDYARACRRMHCRQDLTVEYCSALYWFSSRSDAYAKSVVACNFRGSVEQCCAEFMLGEPHDQHHRADAMTWVFDSALYVAWRELFSTIAKMLRPDGVVMIHANGATNTHEYDREVQVAAGEFLTLVQHEPLTIHKWGVPCPA